MPTPKSSNRLSSEREQFNIVPPAGVAEAIELYEAVVGHYTQASQVERVTRVIASHTTGRLG